MAGYILTAQTINNEAGNVALQLRQALDRVQVFNTWLTDPLHADANLLAAPFSMVQGDITLIKNSFIDLNKLALISHAQATQPAASDFWTNAKQLVGLN